MVSRIPISVVIPTMNRPDALKKTIESLLLKTIIPSQIIIVDQSDKIENQLENKKIISHQLVLTEIKYIFQKIPSLTKARNTGFNYCKNEIIICSDDDVDVNVNTIKNIHELMSNINIAMIAGIDKNKKESHNNLGYIFGTKSFINRKKGHVTLSMLGRYPKEVHGNVDTQWAMGYFFVIRKSLTKKWNLKWDEKLVGYAYAEDLDFSYSYFKRAKSEGLRCILSETVKVHHLVSKEWRITPYKNTIMYVINREYLSYKHYKTPLARFATRWTNFGNLLYRILKNNSPKDLIIAQYYCDKYRKEIRKGNISYKLYSKRFEN